MGAIDRMIEERHLLMHQFYVRWQKGKVTPEALRSSIPGFTGGLVVYVAGTLIAAYVSALAAVIIYGLLAVYYLFEHLPSPAGAAAVGRRGVPGGRPPGQQGPGRVTAEPGRRPAGGSRGVAPPDQQRPSQAAPGAGR